MKFCKDCKHYIKRGEWSAYDRCNRKNLIDPNVINDMTKFCYSERQDGWFSARLEGTCGREGRFYEQKEVDSVRESTKSQLLSELNTVVRIINGIPQSSVIDLMSLEARRSVLEAEIAELTERKTK